MTFQPFQVPCSVYNFIDAGLQKQNREKSGDKNLEQVQDRYGHGRAFYHRSRMKIDNRFTVTGIIDD